MPFTPYHFGPGLLLGILLFPFVDFGTLIIASVILDIEPLAIIIFNLPLPLHGFFHTYFGATIASVVLSSCIWPIRNQLNNIVKLFGLDQRSTFSRILFASLLGTYSHVFLDAFLYAEMNPFYPLLGNPFLGLVGSNIVYSFCVYSLFIGFLLYAIRILYVHLHTTRNRLNPMHLATAINFLFPLID
jgi:membrane-bound metal-dependent hydrolase YbcI (DUF457 family)